jgi:hypothetical protein
VPWNYYETLAEKVITWLYESSEHGFVGFEPLKIGDQVRVRSWEEIEATSILSGIERLRLPG